MLEEHYCYVFLKEKDGKKTMWPLYKMSLTNLLKVKQKEIEV